MNFNKITFNPNKTLVEIISEGAFGGTYFRDIYSGVNGKWCRNSWKEVNFLEDIDPKLYSSIYYNVNVNKYGVKCGTSLQFWENEGWIHEQDRYGWFQWYSRYYLGRRTDDDKRQIKRWNGIINRFKGILVKMIKNKKAKFNDASISPKRRQILLHWRYELVKVISLEGRAYSFSTFYQNFNLFFCWPVFLKN